MRLQLDKEYSLFTISDYITNKKIRVCGYISYEIASRYQSFVENLAINEKFINLNEDTNNYLQKQHYYDCCEIKLIDNKWVMTENHIIVWDDIIDFERTQKLNEYFVYKFQFKINNTGTLDDVTEEDIINTIKETLKFKFNALSKKIDFNLNVIQDNSLVSTEDKLVKAEKILEDTGETLKTFINLQKNAEKINSDFIDNDISGKVHEIAKDIESIKEDIDIVKQHTN